MLKLPNLPDDARLADLFSLFPEHAHPLLLITESVLRGSGELSIANRELIAAYISGLNACNFCMGAHKRYAEAFGVDEGLLDELMDDLDSARIEDSLKELLRYLRDLNSLPSKLTQSRMDKVLGAGITEKALFEAIQIAGVFNMMNRIVEGTGVSFDYNNNESAHPAFILGEKVMEHSYINK